MPKMMCPRCSVIYDARCKPTKNPGGLGAADGWSCLFCTDKPSDDEIPDAPPFAAFWHPVYLVAYDGDREADFTLGDAAPPTPGPPKEWYP